jgi:hypothetical protein
LRERGSASGRSGERSKDRPDVLRLPEHSSPLTATPEPRTLLRQACRTDARPGPAECLARACR